jgi:1,4-alpha-glucan branching enzyme
MNRINLIALVSLLFIALGARAQIITTSPAVLQESSTGVVIYYHADQGNKGLANQPSSDPIYAHTGVITNKSTGSSDWKYAPTWGNNADKYKLTYVSENLWQLEIGDIRSYYGISDASESVKQLAFVFRNAGCSKEGKTASGGDIFVDVAEEGLRVSISADIDGNLVKEDHKNVTFTANASKTATISILVNGTSVASQDNVTTLSHTYNFVNNGTYTITASATAAGETVTDEITLTYPKSSEAKEYPGGTPKMGCVRNADGSVTFCLAAPRKSGAILVGSWDDYKVLESNTMYYQDNESNRYFWITVSGLNSTDQYPYYFLVDGVGVGDPYAKLILDPYYDKYISTDVYPNLPAYPTQKVGSESIPLAVYQENINDYDWKVKNFSGVDKSSLLIYELLLRDFTGTEGESNGNGTLRAAMEKLDYIKTLGMNAVELLPVTEFNGNQSWGYNPNFYFAPDKAYGTPDDYKAFIDACHSRGMAVILDMVFNQSDWLHPWYQLYSGTADNPFYNASAPHAYSVLNDWNQDNALVQRQFEDCLKYWLKEYKVDGFRFDLVKGLGSNSSYPNSGDSATNQYNGTRVSRMKALHAAMSEVNPNAYCINENLATAKEENEMAEDGELNWANVNSQGGQYAMGYSSDSALARFYAPKDSSRTWGSTVSYLESHDEERIAYMQNQNAVSGVKGSIAASMGRIGSAMAQMILAPGAHMIWQFSELGNFESTKNASGNSTDNKKVNWSLFDNETRKGLYTSISELNGIRNKNTDLFAQTASFSSQCESLNWGEGRFIYATTANKELVCVVNPNTSGENTFSVSFRSSSNGNYQILSKTYNTNPTFDAANGTVTLPANSYVVIANMDVTKVENISATDADAKVFGGEGCIVVEGSYDSVSVYNVAGQRFGGLRVPAGIYIVNVDGCVSKVLVR